MMTDHIIENLKKELEDRDRQITRLKKKNHELQCVFNDWIEKDLIKQKKKWPGDYLKQKKEFSKSIIDLNEETSRVSEILRKQQERHDDEIKRLKFEIELLKEQIPKSKFTKFIEEKFFGK